jgi:thiamine-monophosphate kinase
LGDDLWVSGTIGDAGLGLQIALGTRAADAHLIRRYRRPTPRLALGLALRGLACAAIDVSDGLLMDAARLAQASGLCARIDAAAVPLSAPASASGVPVEALAAMGDDYELLFACPVASRDRVSAAAAAARVPLSRIGHLAEAEGPPVALIGADGAPIALRATGFLHR